RLVRFLRCLGDSRFRGRARSRGLRSTQHVLVPGWKRKRFEHVHPRGRRVGISQRERVHTFSRRRQQHPVGWYPSALHLHDERGQQPYLQLRGDRANEGESHQQ
ncbi:unnamed protein product, partial [Laminaria digitata]